MDMNGLLGIPQPPWSSFPDTWPLLICDVVLHNGEVLTDMVFRMDMGWVYVPRNARVYGVMGWRPSAVKATPVGGGMDQPTLKDVITWQNWPPDDDDDDSEKR